MATPNEFEEIIKGLRVMINGFVAKGILPCSEMDVIKGKLPPEKNLMFLSFGIDLKVAITCFPLDPFIPLVKLESKDGIIDSTCISTKIHQDIQFKTEYSSDNEIFDDPFEDENNELLNTDEVEESDIDDCDSNDLKRKSESCDDEDYEPVAKDAKKENAKVVHSPKIEKIKKDSDGTRKRKVFRRQGCQECAELCIKSKKFRFHYVDVHSFDVVRGLSIGGKGKSVQFMSHELLLEKKEALKNQFDIQIPPPEFTKEEFDSCNIEEIISNCLLTDLSTKVKQIGKRSDNFVCLSCKYQFKSINQHKEHYIKYHRMKFKCPKENCNHNKNQDISLVDFVKHYYFHFHDLPQFNYLHQCLDCNYDTPFVSNVYKHVQSNGPFHDNKCPRCDQRFLTRQEKMDHIKLMKHEGWRCGFCSLVFEDENKLTGHRHYCKNKPNNTEVCHICGKDVGKSKMTRHLEVWHKKDDQPKTCDQCGRSFDNEKRLKEHVAANHRTKKPCEICGKMLTTQNARYHMLQYHTPDHLMPFVCHICKKGFIWKVRLDNHINGHLGRRPYKCKYCNATFADSANKRMHERCNHEGYKRK